jgi:hypothetical protein
MKSTSAVKSILSRTSKLNVRTRCRAFQFILALLVTLAILVVIELPSSPFFSPVGADENGGATYQRLTVNGPTTLDGAAYIATETGTNQQKTVYAQDVLTGTSTPFGCNYNAVGGTELVSAGKFGCLNTTAYHGIRSVNMDGQSAPFIAIRSDGYTQLSGDTGGFGLGTVYAMDTEGNSIAEAGALMVAKNPANTDTVRAAFHMAIEGPQGGWAHMGTFRHETTQEGSRERPGASVEVDWNGNVVFTLPSSSTAVCQTCVMRDFQLPEPDRTALQDAWARTHPQ